MDATYKAAVRATPIFEGDVGSHSDWLRIIPDR